jgi:hypothetical protein
VELTQSPATASGSWAFPFVILSFLNRYPNWIDLASLDHRIRWSLPKALQLPPAVGRFPLSACENKFSPHPNENALSSAMTRRL